MTATGTPTSNNPADPEPSIIYVDDDDDLLRLASLCFSLFGGTDIASFSDVIEFQDIFEKGRFSILLFDWQMPHMTGIELAEWVRKVKGDGDATIVLVTARDVRREADVMQRLRIAGVIAKPFEPDELPSRVLAMHQNN